MIAFTQAFGPPDLRKKLLFTLIMAGVGLGTVKQIETQLQLHDYRGFLSQASLPREKSREPLAAARH